MPTLNDGNIKDICKQIPKKGYTKKYWQDHRARSAHGSGIGATMESLTNLGMDSTGNPTKIPRGKLENAVPLYEKLNLCFTQAKKKAEGKKSSHTVKFCQAYSEQTVKYFKQVKQLHDAYKKDLANASKAASDLIDKQKQEADDKALLIQHDTDQLKALVKVSQTMQAKMAPSVKTLTKLSAVFNQQIQQMEQGGPGAFPPKVLTQVENGFKQGVAKANLKAIQSLVDGGANSVKKSNQIIKSTKDYKEIKAVRKQAVDAVSALAKMTSNTDQAMKMVAQQYKKGIEILADLNG